MYLLASHPKMTQQQRADQLYDKATQSIQSSTYFYGLLGSPPNHLQAVQDFQQAANLYRSTNPQKAIESLVKASECHVHLNSSYLGAKCLETAASLSTDNDQKPNLYIKSSEMYLETSPEKACEMLEKAAQSYESTNPVESVKVYWRCVSLYEEEDMARFSLDAYRRFLGFCLQTGR